MDLLTKSVFAIFQGQNEARLAVENLERAGFPRSNISVLGADRFKFISADAKFELHTYLLRGVKIGVILGSSFGLVFGFIVYYLASPAVVNIHPIFLLLFFGFFGALIGTGIGALIGSGVPETRYKRYARYLGEGGSLIAVHYQDNSQKDRALQILASAGGFEFTSDFEGDTIRRIAYYWNQLSSAAGKQST